jgi:hypothetical protein
MARKSFNLKYSLVLTVMFRYQSASQFVERHHSVMSCSLNMEDLISNNFRKFSNKVIKNISKGFWFTLY